MKTNVFLKTMMAASLMIASTAVWAETVHQSSAGTALRTGDGKNAIEKGQAEAKKIDGAESGQVTRIKGTMEQWGFVTCWFGLPAPAGKCTVRVRVFVDDQKPAKCLLYTAGKGDHIMIGELAIPTDAKPNTFVTINVPVDAKDEWSGLTLKKAEKSDLPSPWIDTMSIVLPD